MEAVQIESPTKKRNINEKKKIQFLIYTLIAQESSSVDHA